MAGRLVAVECFELYLGVRSWNDELTVVVWHRYSLMRSKCLFRLKMILPFIGFNFVVVVCKC